jgi:hypothetical protein
LCKQLKQNAVHFIYEQFLLPRPSIPIAILPFTLLNGFFNRVGDQLGIPIIAKGLFCPNYRFKNRFQLIMAAFTNVPMSQVKIVTPRNRLLNSMPANIASKGLHVNAPHYKQT